MLPRSVMGGQLIIRYPANGIFGATKCFSDVNNAKNVRITAQAVSLKSQLAFDAGANSSV